MDSLNSTLTFQRRRIRRVYALAGGLTLVLGLSTRHLSPPLSQDVASNAGDTLWALFVYLLIAWLRPQFSIALVALTTAIFSATIETSQLYHAPWIEALRHTLFGGLILGYGFAWTDLLCYGVGVVIGMTLSGGLNRMKSVNSKPLDA
jgi:hypothetical protein